MHCRRAEGGEAVGGVDQRRREQEDRPVVVSESPVQRGSLRLWAGFSASPGE